MEWLTVSLPNWVKSILTIKQNLWISGGIGFGTALFVPVFTDEVKRWWKRPALTLKVALEEGRKINGHLKYWHLVVENIRKGTVAKNVQVFCTGYQVMKANGRFGDWVNTPHIQFVWPCKIGDVVEILGKRNHQCDLCNTDQHKNLLVLKAIPEPNELQTMINQERKPFRLRFVAKADDYESEPIVVEITWPGDWAPAVDLEKKLVVKLVKS